MAIDDIVDLDDTPLKPVDDCVTHPRLRYIGEERIDDDQYAALFSCTTCDNTFAGWYRCTKDRFVDIDQLIRGNTDFVYIPPARYGC